MATTTYGSPYVQSTDLVANWPAASLTVANSIDAAGYYIGRGINAQTASYTTVLTDAGKTVTMTNAGATTLTIPANSSVAYVVGTRINILNLGAGACTPTAGAGVTISGTITALATNKAASVIKTATNTWSYVPFSSGADAAVVTSTTGSPTITTDGTATVYKYTGDGTMVIGTAGAVRLLVIGAGGGGGNDGGGGAGGFVTTTSYILAAETWTIKIGAGGATTTVNGGNSVLLSSTNNPPVTAYGGGGGTVSSGNGQDGASGGGSSRSGTAGQPIYGGQGFAGALQSGGSIGQGGGGAGGAGTNGATTGFGGAAKYSDILVTGVNVYYAGGGNGTAVTTPAGQTAQATNGAANTGNGAGGYGASKAGGSGVVIVRVG
jgi:hypothetical protein